MLAAQANTGLGNDVNMLEAMEMFKSIPDKMLPQYAQDPKLALFAAAEMARREDMRKRYAQKAQKPNKPVVAQLAEAIAPSMPQMPPGMNAPQEPQPTQMAPSQQPDMAQQMPQPMQAGLGGLMPEQRMAQGGPVAFSGGLLVDPNLAFTQVEEEQKRIPVQINPTGDVKLMTRDEAVKFGMSPAQVEQKFAQQSAGKPKDTAQPVEQPMQLAQAPAAPQMTPEQIIKAGRGIMNQLGIQSIQVPEAYETANRADELYKQRQGRFTDEISPIMEEMKKFYGQQASKEDIQKAANRQMALALMGSKERNLLAGLAGGIQAGEETKKSMAQENRALQQMSLNAQLAHAKYKDAIRRGDFDAAERAAKEERTLSLQIQKLKQEQAVLPFTMGLEALRATTPKGGGEAGFTPAKATELNMKVLEVAKPELDALDTEYKKRADSWFYSGPQNWKEDPEYLAKRRKIIERVKLEQAPLLMGVKQVSTAQMDKLTKPSNP